MLSEFLLQHQTDILALTEAKTLELAGGHPTSNQLKQGLPIFYAQVIDIVSRGGDPAQPPAKDVAAVAAAADKGDEPGMAAASGQPEEAHLAEAAGRQGLEYLRLGYTLSHVVHAYGAMCQSITEVASKLNVHIEGREFHALNRCLDTAIAGAVTEYQRSQDALSVDDHVGGLAREMRNVLTSVRVAFQSIQRGIVGVRGSTGEVLDRSLTRLEALIDRSLTDGAAAR